MGHTTILVGQKRSPPKNWAFYSRFNGDDQKKGFRLKYTQFTADLMAMTYKKKKKLLFSFNIFVFLKTGPRKISVFNRPAV